MAALGTQDMNVRPEEEEGGEELGKGQEEGNDVTGQVEKEVTN